MDREDKTDSMMDIERMKPERQAPPLSTPPSPPPLPLLPPKYKQIKVNDLKWIRYLIILSS